MLQKAQSGMRGLHRFSRALRRLGMGPDGCDCIEVNAGTITEEECKFLSAMIAECRGTSGPIIEIGALFGFTTNEMALAKEPERPLLAVDSFVWNPWGLSPSEHAQLINRVLRVAVATLNVSIVKADKNEFYENYAGQSPCLVFLDAVHSYEETKKDIEWAVRVKCPRIAGHDYSDKFPGVVQAVQEFGKPEVHGTVWALRS